MSVNKAIIVGNLGNDPEPIANNQGCKFSIATNERWTDKSGQRQEKTEWHNIVCWGKTAENCVKYLSKGRQVYVEGRLETDQYEKDGVTCYSTKIIAFNVTFLSGEGGAGNGGGNRQPKQRPAAAPAPAPQASVWDDDFEDDDIPF